MAERDPKYRWRRVTRKSGHTGYTLEKNGSEVGYVEFARCHMGPVYIWLAWWRPGLDRKGWQLTLAGAKDACLDALRRRSTHAAD